MRPNQTDPPPNGNFEGNVGSALLPGQGAEMPDYPTLAPEYSAPQPNVPTGIPVQIPRATLPTFGPPLGQTQDWRQNAQGYGGPATSLAGTMPDYGRQYEGQGWFHSLINSIFGGVGDLAQGAVGGVGDLAGGIGDLGGLLRRIRFNPAPSRPAMQAPSGFNRTQIQSQFPGSAIGPLSGGRNNPFQPGAKPVTGPGSLAGITSPSYATIGSSVVQSRNII